MAGEPSSDPAAAAASNKGSEKPRKSFDAMFQGVKRVFTLSRKSKASKPVAPTTEEAPPPLPEPVAPAPVATPKAEPSTRPTPGPPPPAKSAADRKAEIFKKHGLEMSPALLPSSDKPPIQRVHKEIRMRVHRTCHRCKTGFGAEKTCLSCGHRRCKQCPRFPLKKDKGKEKEKVGDKREVKPIVRRRKGDFGLTLPSRTGGQDLVRKKIRQRVHRTCHRCATDFGAEKICSNCKHHRCKKCPRDPHKKNKPPGYYDGRDSSDSEVEPIGHRPLRTYKKIRSRIHWTCTKCSATFLQGSKICESCGSQRDDTGIRNPPKKNKNPNAAIPSDSYREHLEERLMATSIA
ncbi:hypothetical protein BGX38DRAFT_668150 [Terfezia claveryi]|nr:hypothetical protein BGX38DRAFT_668150 [Terfezia claveryi]